LMFAYVVLLKNVYFTQNLGQKSQDAISV